MPGMVRADRTQFRAHVPGLFKVRLICCSVDKIDSIAPLTQPADDSLLGALGPEVCDQIAYPSTRAPVSYSLWKDHKGPRKGVLDPPEPPFPAHSFHFPPDHNDLLDGLKSAIDLFLLLAVFEDLHEKAGLWVGLGHRGSLSVFGEIIHNNYWIVKN